MPGKPFIKGDKRRNNGGSRKGAGRKLDWLKEEISKIGDPCKVVKYLYDISQGKEKETVLFGSQQIQIPISTKDRIRASEAYLDRQLGKVAQPLEHSGKDGQPLNIQIVQYGGSA